MVTSATYPAGCGNIKTCNKPTSVTDSLGQVTDFTYDANHGGVLAVRSPSPTGSGARPEVRTTYGQYQARYLTHTGAWTNGSAVWRPTTYSACAAGEAPACLGTVSETRTTLTYPGAGTANNALPNSSTVAAGNGAVSATSSLTYTYWGDVLTIDGPLAGSGDTTRYYHDILRRVTGVVEPDPDAGGGLLHRATRMTFNAAGQPTLVEVGTVSNQTATAFSTFSLLELQETVYDTYARPVQARARNGASTESLVQTGYDSRGRASCVAVRMNPATYAGLPADACTQTSAGSFGQDRISRRHYNGASQLTSVQSAYGTSLVQTSESYTYTDNGMVATRLDARNYLTKYEYDGLGRSTRHRYPDPNVQNQWSASDYEETTFSSSGLVSSQRTRAGDSFFYSYDNLGRATLRDAPGAQPDVSYSYDLLGRTTTVSQAGNAISLNYDALSRLTSQVSSVFGTVGYQYDAAGRRTQMSWPDGFYVTYGYDTASRLTAIYEYGAGSPLATFNYDNLGRRTALNRGNGVATSYGFDAISRLASLSHNPAGSGYDTTINFNYNPAGQVTTRSRSNGVYDWVLPSSYSQSYAADGLNRYTSALGVTPNYDARGNLTGDGTRTYGYDADNRLTSASGGVSAEYDPLSRLHQITGGSSTRFLYDGSSVIAEYNGSGVVLRRFVHGPGVDEPLVVYEGAGTGDRRWFLADERGSVVGISDGSGAVTQVNRFDAWGEPSATNQGRFQYTGQVWLGEVGLYHYKARAYHPRLGRFMQTDPIGYSGGLNLYAYVGNDSINLIDPTGFAPCPKSSGPTETDTFCLDGDRVTPPGGGTSGGAGGGGRGSNANYPNAPPDKWYEWCQENALCRESLKELELCLYEPMNQEDETLIRELFRDPEVGPALNLVRNLTLATGIEHGIFIFRNPEGRYIPSNGYRGRPDTMGDTFSQAHVENMWRGWIAVATAHGHPGFDPRFAFPSGTNTSTRGDIPFNGWTETIGIVASSKGFVSGRRCKQ